MKVLVAHPAQQHSYRLAAALKQNNRLYRYATTVYYKPHSLTALTARLLKGMFKQKAQGRRCRELEDDEVIQFCEGEGLLKLLARNTGFFHRYYNRIKYHNADRFAVKAARYAIKHQVDAVVTYDNTSPLLFEILKEKAPHILRIGDTSAANPFYMKAIYEKDFELAPAFSEQLRKERRLVWDPAVQARTEREIALTQHFLVPSGFVAASLAVSGVKKEQLHICPYGVDTATFAPKTYAKTDSDKPLECIYVGGVKELKGIYYLLEAIRKMDASVAHLTVVGNADLQSAALQPYLSNVSFTGTVLHSEIPLLLQNADVFVFPSLGEGLSLSVLEAAACGLPLIVSENAGVADVMQDGREGFLIPIQNTQAIVEKITWFTQHREQLAVMGSNAAALAAQFTWEAYADRINAIFDELQS